jgi:hypothetical protein
MERLEQRHARHTPTDATDDRQPWMVYENINQAFMMLGQCFLVSARKHDLMYR